MFFGVQSLAWAAGIISQPLLVTLRHRDPWLAVYAGLAMICACAALVLFLPATRDAASLTGTSCVTEESSSTSSTWATNWYARVKSATRPLWTTARWILLDNKTLGAVLLGVLFVNMSALSPSTAYRYALERFDWSRERVVVGILRVSSWSTLAVTAVALPVVAQVLTRLDLTPLQQNVWLARVVVFTVMIGHFISGLSTAWGPLVVGTALVASARGFFVVSRSLLAILGNDRHLAALFSLAGAVEIVSYSIRRPLAEWLLRVGRGWGDAWYGLPYFVGIILAAVGAVVAVSLRPGGRLSDEQVQDDEAA